MRSYKIIAVMFSVLGVSFQSQAQILSSEMDRTDPLQQEVLRIIPEMEARIGRTLPMSVVVWNSGRRLSEILDAERIAVQGTAAAWVTPAFVSSQGYWERDGAYSPTHSCLIQFTPSGYLATGAVLKSIIAHEVYHCFQFALVGHPVVSDLPRWVIEGGAAFAGEYFAMGSDYSRPFWEGYFGSTPFNLKSYSAIGLFATLNSMGYSDVFQKMDELITVADRSNLWLKLGQILTTHEKSGISAAAKMNREWGENYFIDFPEVPPSLSLRADPFGEIELPMEIPLNDAWMVDHQFRIPLNKIVKIKITSGTYGRIRIMKGDGTSVLDQEIVPNEGIKVCRGTQCGCPSGNNAYDVVKLDDDAAVLHMYLLPFSDGTPTIKFEEAPPGCCEGSQAIDERLIGEWNLDVSTMVNALKPVPHALITVNRGEHRAYIDRSGVISRSGAVRAVYEWTENSGRTLKKSSVYISSSARACLETRPTGPNKGWIFHRTLSENSFYSIVSSSNGRASVLSENIEHPMIRWGTGLTGENGVYEINRDQLRVRGEPRTYYRQ